MTVDTPKTGIKVIVVGAGFGGLTAAIECHRQGHDVRIYESFPALKSLGDIISFGANAGRIFYRWNDGKIAEKLQTLSHNLNDYGFRIHKYDTGEVVLTQPPAPKRPTAPVFNGHRGELHEVVFRYAEELGIQIHLGARVKRYFEDVGKAGVELESGETVYHHQILTIEKKKNGLVLTKGKVFGDVVLGADGVRSKARELVLGYDDKPKSSGYAIWRAW